MSDKKYPLFSIITPLYNEEGRIDNLSKIYGYLDKQNFSYEILLINDGSNDHTLNEIRKLKKKFKFNLISYNTNRGKGFAVKKGMLKANGQYRIFIDIDLSTPIEELSKILPFLEENEVIICSRKIAGSKLEKKQPLLRESLGKGFTKLSQIILNLKISDFTCGFKCFSKKAAEEIFSRQRITRWGFDSEILFIAKKLGFDIKEIPVTWTNNSDSKVKFPQAIINSFTDLIKIRYYDLKKLYN